MSTAQSHKSKKSKSSSKKKPNSPIQKLQQGSRDGRLASLEANSKGLADIVDQNAAVLRDGLEVTEARQYMIMKAMDDMVTGNVVKAVVPGATDFSFTGVDWDHYKNQYIEYAKTLEAAKEPPKTEEADIPPEAAVFGGD